MFRMILCLEARLLSSDGNLIVPVINKVQGYFDLVVATQDWHPKNHKSFASNHFGKNHLTI